ncbi:3'-5' exonuclease [Piscinibacter sp.]|uniref:3'-5' exonuclease n=1 Tax=Piscinibacter sp. TaxID=1903157 RepID=UPI002F41C0A7
MTVDRRYVVSVLALASAMALWLAVVVAVLWSSLSSAERDALPALTGDRVAVLVMASVVALALVAVGLRRLHRHFVEAPARLLEQAQAALAGDVEREIEASGSLETRGLARAFNDLVAARAYLRRDIEHMVQEASRDIEQERMRLAALMSELNQSVVVCNLNGRILLYNNQARLQFKALSDAPAVAGGAELMGLGRSIYAVFDPKLVAHALENVRERMRRGAANPSTQFVTAAPAGQLLRVTLAPVRGATAQDDITGFVLMQGNITRQFEDESVRDQHLHALTESTRASLASLQAAVEALDYPDVDDEMRERLLRVIRDEVGAMGQRIRAVGAATAEGLKTRWPLEDMLGADVVQAALRRIESACAMRAGVAEVDGSLWLKVDSFSLLQALTSLACRLHEELGVRGVELRLIEAGPHRAHLDLIWSGQALNTETAMSWELDPMKIGTETLPLTVRDVVARHGGEFWFERERTQHRAFFRFRLPLATAQDEPSAAGAQPGDSRPEFYDFDLFQSSPHSRELDERTLAEITYTVFDTETTGLDPSLGDEIIQIGATRIVNGKLLRQENFEQLVNPQRSIPEPSIAIHGIRPEMLVGQPTIADVLPAFHAFARDTVLVAHNAAFDMRFLQLKEAPTGIRFDQPVLDTLLLSALLHPNQESHALEAIALRLGVDATGRHAALRDAMVTAEVFLKLVPLLADKGIHTLGQAREAARKTYYARLKY